MFGSKKNAVLGGERQGGERVAVVCVPEAHAHDEQLAQAVGAAGGVRAELREAGHVKARDVQNAAAVVALFPALDTLGQLLDWVMQVRETRGDGSPVLVIGLAPDQLTAAGSWLDARAHADALQGIRLVVAEDAHELAREAAGKLEPFTETNVIAMPISTEVETHKFKYFYTVSPELRELLAYLQDLATNNIERIYLLGGPGAGKTSLAYYYYLARRQGNFVTVNLTSESTDDKAAMKSLLCGHVSGAFPGAGARTGAFAHARDGVCFLDESHGVSGSVMEVLMEALDSGQYLPYGASTKQPVNCAVVFASNRNWETLVASVNIDEHARLGASIMHLPDLAVRREDLIAVLAVTLERMRARATTWEVISGLTAAAWDAILGCPWHGNTRALIRVVETAYVDSATSGARIIDAPQIQRAIELWEPAEHASHAIYTSAGGREEAQQAAGSASASPA